MEPQQQKQSENTDHYVNQYENYMKYKQTDSIQKIELPSFLRMVGELERQDVIDLACGGGFYTRVLQSLTQGKVFGVDLSMNFIKAAKLADIEDRIVYINADCGEILTIPDKFDVVTSTFLLQYARSEEQLLSFLETIKNLCKPGARIIGLNVNFKTQPSKLQKLSKYGFKYRVDNEEEIQEGDPRYVSFQDQNCTVQEIVIGYQMKPEVYERCFKQAGFEEFSWQPLNLDTREVDPEGYWDDFLNNPHTIGFTAKYPVDNNQQE